MSVIEDDRYAANLALGATGLLAEFNRAGVLASADVHVAQRLGELTGEQDETVLLAAALAVRAPRLGHVLVDLAHIRDTATAETDAPAGLATLAWPEPVEDWVRRVGASPLTSCAGERPTSGERPDHGEHPADARPLRLWGSWLYLDRLWTEERELAAELSRRSVPSDEVDADVLRGGLQRLFAEAPPESRQRLAAAVAVLRRLTVIAGGPGTGKTTTVARIVALLIEQSSRRGERLPLVALAAPSGKAAARLREAVQTEAGELRLAGETREALRELESFTLHRLLGARPGSEGRPRHHRGRRLPHDVVIVDETSMVSLSMMARLVDALRPAARLVLLGDPGQLASVEAGAVLGDIVGPATSGLRMSPEARARLGELGLPVPAAEPAPTAPVADGIVTLTRGHRFGGTIAAAADAIRAGDAEAMLTLLQADHPELRWLAGDPAQPEVVEALREPAMTTARALIQAGRAGRAEEALGATLGFRMLCAHRRGPYGVSGWTARIEGWLAAELPDFDPTDPWYPGRPVIVGENDPELGLFNGDAGVIVSAPDGGLDAVFDRGGHPLRVGAARLGTIATAYAMTIHRSQGSQFDSVAVVLPPPESRILTRELLLTALTRARRRLIVAGREESLHLALARPVARASGLRRRLWEEEA